MRVADCKVAIELQKAAVDLSLIVAPGAPGLLVLEDTGGGQDVWAQIMMARPLRRRSSVGRSSVDFLSASFVTHCRT